MLMEIIGKALAEAREKARAERREPTPEGRHFSGVGGAVVIFGGGLAGFGEAK